MSSKTSNLKEKAIESLIVDSKIDFPSEYLDFLSNRDDYIIDVEAGLEFGTGLFEIYPAEDVIQRNKDLEVNEYLPGFFVIGGDRANELLAFDTRKPKPWKIYMFPAIVMSEDNVVVIADSFETFMQSEKH